ncbi:MAG: DUF2179 domain-containing protein [Phascolarctobacterium faecium]
MRKEPTHISSVKFFLVVAKLTQVAKIKQIVRDIDPGCFMIIQDANDVLVKGSHQNHLLIKRTKIFCTVDTLKTKIIINCFNLTYCKFHSVFLLQSKTY